MRYKQKALTAFVFMPLISAGFAQEADSVVSITKNGQILEQAFINSIVAIPNTEITVYDSPPDKILNIPRKTTEIPPMETLKIEETYTVPSIFGNQVWMKVTPANGTDTNINSICKDEGCWAYIGRFNSITDDYNFTTEAEK